MQHHTCQEPGEQIPSQQTRIRRVERQFSAERSLESALVNLMRAHT